MKKYLLAQTDERHPIIIQDKHPLVDKEKDPLLDHVTHP